MATIVGVWSISGRVIWCWWRGVEVEAEEGMLGLVEGLG